MAWYHKFPWTNFHELNLDWILEICGKAEKAIPDIDKAITRADNAADNANSAADLANRNATTASNAAAVANNAARKIDPITATAATVYGASASVTVEDTNPGKVFHFLIPAGEKGDPGPAGGAGDLIDNGNFTNPVNQRGKTSYNGTGSKVYTIDRWLTTSSVAGAVVVGNRYITVAAGATISQIIPADQDGSFPSDVDVGYTAVARETNGTLHIANGGGLTDSKLSFTIGDADVGITVTLGSGNWEYCALYKGTFTAENVPGYQPAPYVMQLLRCMRFYRKALFSFVATTANLLCPTESFIVPFYKNPTATMESDQIFTPGIGNTTVVNPSIMATSSYFEQITVETDVLTVNRIYRIWLELSADI